MRFIDKKWIFYLALLMAGDLMLPSLAAGRDRNFPSQSGTHIDSAAFEYVELDPSAGKTVIADVNNDGYNDIIRRDTGSESLVWYETLRDRLPIKHVAIADLDFTGDRIAVGDIDGDGDIDIATGIQNDEEIEIVWLRNPLPKGGPLLLNPWDIERVGNIVDPLKDIALADFDRDGNLDIVSRSHEQTTIHFQNDSIQWSPGKTLRHESHEGMDVGDLDKDGDPDIVLNGFWFETPANPRVGDYLKHSIDDKWFTPVEDTWRDNNSVVRVTDVNADGLLDVLLSSSELPGYPISLYMSPSTNAVRQNRWKEITITKQFDFCQTLDVGDIDNDGDMDVLAAKFRRVPSGKRWDVPPPYPVILFENVNGNETVWKSTILSNQGMYAGDLGDVGSDGDLDIVGSLSYFIGPIQMWENQIQGRPPL
jgi:hypothetical protein